ncbi:hypothetical protein DL96DRAFT_1534386 [Flagelloscypha sp. PMI_526]|nr:hypothetical protein DL96DRAFT_1534386 [Flagelloscypha sp. PMI_526]
MGPVIISKNNPLCLCPSTNRLKNKFVDLPISFNTITLTFSMARKFALITGCSEGGIGHEIAAQLHDRGFTVIATARNVNSMKDLADKCLHLLPLDVTQSEAIEDVSQKVIEITGGRLNILVNNAGISYPFSAADMDLKKVKELFEVNLFGVMQMVQTFLPMLLASEDARIVQIGSITAVVPNPFGSAYNASKAALAAYSDTLRIELAPFGIKVVNVTAGNVKSQLSKLHWKLPEDSIYKPIQQEYQDRRIAHFQDEAMDCGPVVTRIITEFLKPNPSSWYWDGTNSTLAWVLTTFFPRVVLDNILSKKYALDKLNNITKQKKQMGKNSPGFRNFDVSLG